MLHRVLYAGLWNGHLDYVKRLHVTSLTAIFGNSPDQPEEGESEKLLNLYWNRAELKKEFAGLREEKFRLQELITQKDGAVARIKQQLDHLEHLLLDPEWADSVVVYFQFRALNLHCEKKLAKFAEQLKQQREQRRQSQQLEDWGRSLEDEAEEVERQIGEQRLQAQLLEDQLQHERHRLATMNGFIKFLRRRSLTARLDDVAQSIHAAQANEEALLESLEEIQNREPPDVEGLDIGSKRLINFTILAFAQQLYLHFCDDDLASLAHQAGERSVGAINYGTKKECDELVAKVQKKLKSLEKASDLADVLQKRARLIAEAARFGSDSDALPNPETVSTVYAFSKLGLTKETDANLLGANYWNLNGILSR
ncbi:MAG: hypothetical protein GWN47_11670 [Woeseiaceae bacterium]|nr:hypothetical protein [Woeseiaceae bacterium]